MLQGQNLQTLSRKMQGDLYRSTSQGLAKITGITVVSPTEAYAASGERVLRFNGSSWATFGERGQDGRFGESLAEFSGLFVGETEDEIGRSGGCGDTEVDSVFLALEANTLRSFQGDGKAILGGSNAADEVVG